MANHRATTPRDPALDLLRSVALARVVLWHTFALSWMTWFAAMPVMFFVAGSLLAASGAARSYPSLLARRSRRILLPLWVYGAVVAVTGVVHAVQAGDVVTVPSSESLWRAVSWVVPLVDPPAADWHGGWLSTHLWYLRAYLWILLLAPLLLLLARRLLVAVPFLVGGLVAFELAAGSQVPVIGAGEGRILVGDAITYGSFAVLGMAYQRRRRGCPRLPLALGAVAAGGGAVAYVHLTGMPAGGINDSYPAIALTGLAWLFAAGVVEGAIRRLASAGPIRRLTAMVNRRAVSIYLWHPAAIVGAYALVEGWERLPNTLHIEEWPAPTLAVVGLVLVLTVVLTVVATAASGWVEDLAAGRRARRRRLPRPALRLAVLPSVATGLAAAISLLGVPIPGAYGAEHSGRAPRPPSYRAALASSDFTGTAVATPADPIVLPAGRMPGRKLDRALKAWVANQPDIRSVAVGVAVDGRVWTGDAHNRGAPAQLHADDDFAVLSLTKTFTGALVLSQVAAGRLDLDAPVPHLPDLPRTRRAATITPRHLLEHTSGLAEYNTVRGYRADGALSAQEAVSAVLRAGLRASPGRAVHYANTNYLYLGLILEHVTGQPYAALVGHLTRRYELAGTAYRPDQRPGHVGFASGGLRSTVGDLAAWGDRLYRAGGVLPPALAEQLTSLGEHNLGLGTWPLCPCSTDAHGEKRYTAIGQHIGHGGLFRFHGDLTVAVRLDPAPRQHDATLVSLAEALRAAFPTARRG